MPVKFKRDICPWMCIGENTGGYIYWCEDCGSIVSEDNSDLQNPLRQDTETWLCHDQGISA